MKDTYVRMAIIVRREEPKRIRFVQLSEKLPESSEMANSQF